MRFLSNWKSVAALLVLLALIVGGMVSVQQPVSGQQAAVIQLPAQVQVLPPGSNGVTQAFWSQTATGAASAATVTQPANSGKLNYCTGFEVTGGGATAASIITVTLASGGTTIGNYNIVVPAGVTTTITPLVVEFPVPFAGLGAGQNMVLTVPTFGAGNTNSAVTMHGFAQ